MKPSRPRPRAAEQPSSPLARDPGLTPREREVLSKLLQDVSDTEIARELHITMLTTNRHIANIMRKLGAQSRTEAAVRAMKAGCVA